MADIAAAEAEGANAFGALQNQQRQRMAYNALVSAYGSQAADPVAWGQATEAAKNETTLPYAAPQAAADVANKTASTNFLGAQTGEAQARTTAQTISNQNAMIGQHLNRFVAATGAGATGGQAFDALHDQLRSDFPNMSDDEFNQLRTAADKDPAGFAARVQGALPKEGTAFGPNGPVFTTTNPITGVPQAAQTNVRPIPATQGAPQKFVDEQGNTHVLTYSGGLAYEGTQVRQPADIAKWKPVSELGTIPAQQNANTRTANSKYGDGMPVLTDQNGAVLDRNTPQYGAAWLDSLPQAGREEVVGKATQVANQEAQRATFTSILDTVDKQIAPYTTGPGSLINKLPGSVQNDLRANLTTAKANELFQAIASLKNAQGQTGIGRFLQTEAQNAINLYGNMEQDQTTKQLAYHSMLLRQSMGRLYQNMRDSFTSNYHGLSPEKALGRPEQTPAAAAPPSLTEGQTGKTKDGTAVIVKDGKWVPK